MLWKVEETVSTAESCTGGEIAATLTKIAGSSNYFKGGIVVYTDESKEKFLGVNPETIEKYTVYSEEVVKEMVKGCCEAFNTTYAIAVSGGRSYRFLAKCSSRYYLDCCGDKR